MYITMGVYVVKSIQNLILGDQVQGGVEVKTSIVILLRMISNKKRDNLKRMKEGKEKRESSCI